MEVVTNLTKRVGIILAVVNTVFDNFFDESKPSTSLGPVTAFELDMNNVLVELFRGGACVLGLVEIISIAGVDDCCIESSLRVVNNLTELVGIMLSDVDARLVDDFSDATKPPSIKGPVVDSMLGMNNVEVELICVEIDVTESVIVFVMVKPGDDSCWVVKPVFMAISSDFNMLRCVVELEMNIVVIGLVCA